MIGRTVIARAFQRMWHELVGRRRIARNRRAMLRKLPVVMQDTYGFRFILYPWDLPSWEQLVQRAHDKADLQAISMLVQKGDVVFDVGAHVGEYSVYLSRLCGEEGRVFAFEPVAETYWMLRETLVLNRCENVHPVQKAMCDKVGSAEMHLFEPRFSAWNSLGKPSMLSPEGRRLSPRESLAVSTETMDHFCSIEQIEHIDFLKIDVEGFEKLVFLGSSRMLRARHIDYICFEISQDPLKGAGLTSRDVFDVLREYEYLAYSFDEPSSRFLGPIEDTSEEWRNFYASWRDLSEIRR